MNCTARFIRRCKKMKKLLAVICTLVLLACVFSLNASALTTPSETVINETVEYFEDGSSVVITVVEYSQNEGISPRVTRTKTGAKSYIYYNSSGDMLWKFVLNGTFQYDAADNSATCVASSYSKTIQDSSWSLKTASATRSGAKAIGNATFVKKVLGITTKTKSCSLELKCDINGNLS